MAESCPCKKCPIKALIENPEQLKAKLDANARYVKAVQGIFLFRLIPQYAALFVLVNLVFLIVGIFHMGFIPVAILVALVNAVGKLIMKSFGEKIINFFFPEEFPLGEEGESNRVRSSDEIVALFAGCKCCQKCQEKLASPIMKLAVLSGLFFFFSITGTYRLNLIVCNLVLVLPGVLLHPAVNPYVLKAKNAIFPPKQKEE